MTTNELEAKCAELEQEVADFKANNRYHRGYDAGEKSRQDEIDTLRTKLTAAEQRVASLEAALDSAARNYCDLAQLLRGWHADGTTWSQWDQQVFEQMLRIQLRVEALRTPSGEKGEA